MFEIGKPAHSTVLPRLKYETLNGKKKQRQTERQNERMKE